MPIDIGEFEEMEAARARDQAAHPPGLNIWGRPLKTEPEVPAIERRRRGPSPTWEPPPGLIEAIQTRYVQTGPMALAEEFKVPGWKIQELRRRYIPEIKCRTRRRRKKDDAAIDALDRGLQPATVAGRCTMTLPPPVLIPADTQPEVSKDPGWIVESGKHRATVFASSPISAMHCALRLWLNAGQPPRFALLVRARQALGKKNDWYYWLVDSLLEDLATTPDEGGKR